MIATVRRTMNCIALIAMVSVGLTLPMYASPALAEQTAQQTPAATKAAVAAAQILLESSEHLAARDLLRAYLQDDKAALIYIRSGMALEQTDAEDFALASRLADAGNLAGARIKGDMLRAGLGVPVDYDAAELAYRHAIDLGDTVSARRLADLYSIAKRYPEAIAAYDALRDNPADEVKFLTLSITRGSITDPAELANLLDRLDQLSLTEAAAARAAAFVYETGKVVPADAARAVTYARRAVALGDVRLGLMAAQDCETCSALEVIGLLKSTKDLADVGKTSIALEKPLARGLYADAWDIVTRFPNEQRMQIVTHMLGRFGAISNPVVGLTQAMMHADAAYDGDLDGMLTSSTLTAIARYGEQRNVQLIRFDDALVTSLFTSTQ